MSDRLILRTVTSPFLIPYNDNTKGNVLSHTELDNNFLYLKGNVIYTAVTSGSFVTLKKLNGDDFTFEVGSGGGGGGASSDFYWTSGSTGTKSIKVNNGTGLDATGNYSVAEGYDTTAGGNYSHAEGYNAHALNNASHAEGSFTIASGTASHAEGNQTTASGSYSHAEGDYSIAGGDSSHAEGSSTIASGFTSHAEGENTTAFGDSSHTEGSNTTANGGSSHAEGNATIASGGSSHTEGMFTIAIGEASHAGGRGTSVSGGAYVVAGGNTSFTHQRVVNGSVLGFGDIGAYGNYSSILGGKDHYIQSGSESGTIVGGNSHLLFGASVNSGIFGGNANLLIDTYYGVVLGGDANGTIQADSSAIVGGYNNVIDTFNFNLPTYSFIGAGSNNKIENNSGSGDAVGDVIMGGDSNLIDGDNSFNGIYNSSNSYLTSQSTSVIINSEGSHIEDGGGFGSSNNTIIGTYNSTIEANGVTYASIFGGANNNIFQENSLAGIIPNYSVIIGGDTNRIDNSDTAVILNGFSNTINTNSKQSSILNGQYHDIVASQFSTIIGGNNAEITDSDGSAIIGGSQSKILSDGNPAFTRHYNGILGGTGNTIDNGELSYIIGGYQNVIPYGKVGVVILGGDSITGSTNNTVYVQRLNIKSANNDNTTTRFLTLDANNNISFRNLSSISGATSGGTGGGDTLWASGTTGIASIKAINSTGLDANGNYAVAINNSTMADGNNSFAAGFSTWARGTSSMSVGQNTESFGNYSFAGGHNTIAQGNNSFIWSTESTATGERSVVLGGTNINGLSADTVYVPFLNVQSASTDNTLSSFLVKNGDGTVKTRTLDVGTPFYLQSSPTTDAGSNKTSLIQRNGGMFIGDYVPSTGIGSFTYINKNSVGISHTGYTYFNQSSYQNSPNDSGSLGMYRQRGTPSAPSNLLNNDKIGDITFTTAAYGISGGSQSDSFIGVYANENHSGTTFGSAMGTRMDFYLIPNGTTSARKALTIIGSGDTRIFGNLTATTISATTYYNLPNQTSVTGFTYSNNNLTIKQSSGDLNVVVNTMTGLTINGNLTFTGQTNNPVYTAGTLTSSFIPNWDNSNLQHVILSAATTSISGGTNIKNGAVYTMIVKQNATGSRLITWAPQYKWQSGIAPVLSSTSNSVDIFTFISDGTNLYGLIAKDFR